MCHVTFCIIILYHLSQASHSKQDGNLSDVKKYAQRAVLLNIVGGISHVVFIIIVIIVFFVAVLVSLR